MSARGTEAWRINDRVEMLDTSGNLLLAGTISNRSGGEIYVRVPGLTNGWAMSDDPAATRPWRRLGERYRGRTVSVRIEEMDLLMLLDLIAKARGRSDELARLEESLIRQAVNLDVLTP